MGGVMGHTGDFYMIFPPKKHRGKKSHRKICFLKMGGVMGHTGDFYMIFSAEKAQREELLQETMFLKNGWGEGHTGDFYMIFFSAEKAQGETPYRKFRFLKNGQVLSLPHFRVQAASPQFRVYRFEFRVQGLVISVSSIGFQGLVILVLGFRDFRVYIGLTFRVQGLDRFTLIGFRVQIGFYSQGLGFISLSIQGLGLQGIRFLGGVPTGHHLASEVFEERSKRKSHGATFILPLPHLLT